jgi:hypothetical protein
MSEAQAQQSYFPSIPKPSRLKNSTELVRKKGWQSPPLSRSSSPLYLKAHNSISYSEGKDQESGHTHFLIKYLERK